MNQRSRLQPLTLDELLALAAVAVAALAVAMLVPVLTASAG